MNESRLNLGAVQELTAECFGEPGQRTFRLRASSTSGEISLWIEKYQVVNLAEAVTQMLERVPDGVGETPRPVTKSAQISGEVSARVGSMSLGFDHTQDAFVIEAMDLEDATLDVQSLMLLVSRGQLVELGQQVSDIIAGGRPLCPMCFTPLTDEPHFCPPSNGHAHVREVGPTE